MPYYAIKALRRLQYQLSKLPQYLPHTYTPFKIGKKNTRQWATTPDNSPLLSPAQTRYIQSVTGTFLYYARALDSTILPAVNELSRQQANPTVNTLHKAQHLMDYMATYPNAFLRFNASNMILHVDYF